MDGVRAGRDVRIMMGAGREGGGEGVHGLTVLRFCPKAQSLARRLTALMGQWALGESADSSGITF